MKGLTCDALEWVMSNGGGQIVEADGTISVNNEQAAAAIDRAAGWVAPSRPAAFSPTAKKKAAACGRRAMRSSCATGPMPMAIGNGADSPGAGKFDVVPLPAGEGDGARSAATLGGWNVAVSQVLAENQEAAIELALFLGSPEEEQKLRAIEQANLPTIEALYDDPDVAEAGGRSSPLGRKSSRTRFRVRRPRPRFKLQRVSSLFWSAVHDTLSGNGTAAENLEVLEYRLTELQGRRLVSLLPPASGSRAALSSRHRPWPPAINRLHHLIGDARHPPFRGRPAPMSMTLPLEQPQATASAGRRSRIRTDGSARPRRTPGSCCR
jgi:trehalose/maltose transport system substrate-binding protein